MYARGTTITQDEDGERLRRRLGALSSEQIRIWRRMTPARRIALAGQAYHLALEAVRASERRQHPDLTPEELAWRVVRRMQGDPHLGK